MFSLTQDNVTEYTIPVLHPELGYSNASGNEGGTDRIIRRAEVDGVVRVDGLESVGAIS